MARQSYTYPRATGDYSWNINSKCREAIGREPISRMGMGGNTILTFDPPLSAGDETLISAVMNGPNPANAIIEVINNSYVIKDLAEVLDELEAEIGFPVYITYFKSVPEAPRVDRIKLTFGGRLMTQQNKKAVTDALDTLMVGWV